MRSGSGSTRTTRGWPPISCARLASGISESSWASSAASGRRRSLDQPSPQSVRVRNGTSSIECSSTIGGSTSRRQEPAHRRLPLVDLDQARLVRLVDPEADGDHRQPGARHGVDVLDAGDAPQHPLDGDHDPALDLGRLGARPRHHDVHHRHADLRLLLAGRGEERERPEAERGRDEERRELAVEEGVGDRAREAERASASSLSLTGAPSASPAGIEDDALARLDAGADLDGARRRAHRRPPSGGAPGRRSRRRGP